ncbi:MAG TPA: response regulator [Petrimonas sp.]|nr:response regulator [Petrimonas sp.]
MKSLRKRYFIFSVLFTALMVNSTFSKAYPDYRFKHYDINNGLSQNTVYSIFQDNQGFMWFGTKDGLNRFDGTNFKTFHFSPDNDLRDNVFKRILQDSNDDLWVATDEGVYIYNPHQESFRRFDEQTDKQKSVTGTVSDMIMDRDGDIWISVEGEGVFHYSISQSQLYFYEVPLSDGMKILSLCAGKDNDVWVFPYSRPFLHIDKKTKTVSEFELQDDPALLWNVGEVSSILADKYNELILATSQKGLLSINTVNRTHRVLLDKDKNGEPVFARILIRVDDKTLWVGSESGIYIFNDETMEVTNLRNNNSIPYSLSDNAVYSLYKDRDNGIWVGTYFGGLNYYANRLSGFDVFYAIDNINSISGNRVREFCNAGHGKIWIGTEDKGLNLFDPVTNTFLPIDNELRKLYTNIHALFNDGRYLWISTFSKGLNRYDLNTGKLITYTQYDNPETIIQNSTFTLCKDRQNMLWIGTLSGVNIYDYSQDSFQRVKELEGISVQDIVEDSDGNIWIATFQKGLYRYNPLNKQWHTFQHDHANNSSLPYNKTTSIFEDSKKRLWVTTQGGGFCLFNKKDETFSTINSANGLVNNVVYQIQEDNEGNLWLSTNSGIVRFNPETHSFRNYTVINGLRTNQFNYKSSFKAADGTLYFGSVAGFVRFQPSYFKEIDVASPVVFTDFQINNYSADIAVKNSPLDESIQYTKSIRLSHNKNSIGFKYAVLDYSGLNTTNVIYKLEGFDKEWVKSNANNSILYTNLSPGKYRLLIAFEDEDSMEKNAIKILNIHIEPPFWQTWWAYLLYLFIFLGVIWLAAFLSHVKSEKIQARKMRVFQQEKERELYRSKIDFFTSVAHEIRTPLSLIKAPLDYVITTEEVSEGVKENLQIMSKNTDRLLSLTNQLLDFQKTESDAYLLNLEPRNVSELIRETFLRFTPLAKQRGLLFEMDLPEKDMYVQVDKEAFLKIISNLMNNAVKYCNSFVRIKAYIAGDGENPAFHLVTDNDGEKIPDKYKQAIFKPFVHLDKEHDQTVDGTGIGLALSRSLAELHKGTLELEDSEEFIRFHLTLPMDSTIEAAVEPSGETAKSSHTTVLLVEDDLELLNFEKKFLSPHYRVLTAENGEEALEILRESNVNLVVSDIMMPEMDGLELTQKIKTDIEFSHIPVILLTAKVSVESKVQGFEIGADAYIDKPFSLEVLMAQIANLLQNREKLRETFLKHPYIGANSMALTKSDEEFIRKLHAIVLDNMDNSEFIVEDMAEQFNMSRASFYRKIKGVLNLTPNEYIRAERLKKAAQLLKDKIYKVNEICYMVGFNSPSYFSKCFQQQFGVLPRDFE